MPVIFQLPSLNKEKEEERGTSVSGNGILGLAPPPRPLQPARPTVKTVADESLHTNPFTLLEEEFDVEQERMRRREAVWISITLHAVVLLLLYFVLPRWLARHPVNPTAADLLQDHTLTMLQLPPTKPETPTETDKLSDQNRRAMLRHPDLQTLRKLMDATPPGAPAQQAPAQPTAPAEPPMQTAENNSALTAPAQRAKASTNPFNTTLSAGSAIQQAVQATAGRRGVGPAGDYGSAPSAQPTNLHSNVDVLSDTMGVDFNPYLKRVLQVIRENWYTLIPEEAREPLMKQGKVSIQFAILKDGTVQGMQLITPSGDVALDRAAWGGITASYPFQPLPAEFKGPYLALRLHFYYNPAKGDLQ
jgi:TonB family protein